MPVPFIFWAGIAVVGVAATGWAAKEGGEAMDSAANLTKWGAIAGGVYVSYRAMKSTGVLK